MRFFFGMLAALLLTACQSTRFVTYNVTTTPVQPLQPAPQKVLVLNTFDPAFNNVRKNKEALLARLTDTLVKQMTHQLQQVSIDVEPLFGITPVITSADESTIKNLMQQHAAPYAIVIKEADVFFDQTNVEVTKTESGKKREAFYDICSVIRYELYNNEGKIESMPVRHRRFHSSRNVISGVLAAGPSLTNNSNAFFALASENKNLFLHQYFPGFVTRKRSLFTGHAFKPVGNAIGQNNFETALKESLLLTESSNRQTVAKAYYNCAVLSERLNNLSAARRYLQQSLRALRLPQAQEMLYSLGG